MNADRQISLRLAFRTRELSITSTEGLPALLDGSFVPRRAANVGGARSTEWTRLATVLASSFWPAKINGTNGS